MLKRGITVLVIAVALMHCTSSLAQWEDTHQSLDSHQATREFAGSTISTEIVLRAGGNLESGQRALIQIDLDTVISGSNLNMPRAVVINGFVTIAFPPGIEPDGQPRLKYYDAAKDRYEYLYSKSYPRMDRFSELSDAIDDTTSGHPAQMVDGLREICAALDQRVRVVTPTDPRLTGSDKSYAVTGLSWLIPCNVMFKELVGLFDPQTGVGRDAKLRVSLPIRATTNVSNPKLVVYAGGLSAAVDHVNLLPADIPATAIPLAPLPEPVVTKPADPAANEEENSDSKSEPIRDPNNPRQNDGDDNTAEAAGQGAPPPPPEPIPVLVYSYEWLSWETELNLSTIVTAQAPSALPTTPRFDTQLPPELPADSVEEIVSLPPADERPERLNPTPAPIVDDPPPVSVTPPSANQASPETNTDSDSETVVHQEFQATPQENTGVRQVAPGTLPDDVDSYTVALKPITGSGAGQAQTPSTRPVTDNSGGFPATTPATPATNGVGAPPAGLGEMILIPEGYFLMGTAGGSSAGDADEEPQTQVYLDAYYIDRYPVTNRQFHNFVISAGYKPEGNWQKYYAQGTADLPVRGVTWNDAEAFARWAGKRLPSEAEWEKAARSSDGRTYPWGEDWSSDIIPRGEYLYDIMRAETAASPYGVMGMCGLVWQWTASAYQTYPFNPDARGDKRVLRGGAFSNGRNIIRCANRYSESANVALNTFGFRCARDG